MAATMADVHPDIQAHHESDLRNARQFLRDLPFVKPEDAQEDDYCPICFTTFKAILEEQVAHEEKPGESSLSQSNVENCVGLVKLEGCNHIFCRKDILEWLESLHGSCPTCRHVFFQFTPINEADYESSDGGEYIPADEIDEEDFETDDDLFTDDGIPSSDVDFDLSGYHADQMPDSIMDDEENGASDSSISTNVGLTDGEDTLSSDYASSECDDLDDEEAYAGDVSMVSEDDEASHLEEVDMLLLQGDPQDKTPQERTEEGNSHPAQS